MQVFDTPSTTRPFASTTPTPLSPVTVLHQSPQSILDRRQPAAKLHHPPSLLSTPAISTPSLCTVADEPLSSTSFRLSSMTCPSSSSSSLQSSSSSRLASSSSCPVGVVHTHSRNGVTSGVASALPFVPLTPIMGSPRLTPDIGAAAGSVVGGGAGDGSGGGGKTGEPSQRPDYLNRGRVGALVERTGSRQDVMFDSMETWSDGDEHGDDVLRPWSASSGSRGAGTASVAGAQSSWQISSKRRSKSRFAGTSRTSSSMVHRSQRRTSPRGIELGTLPGYEPLPPLSLSPEFRRMEAEMARMDLQGHTVGMTSAPASSSSSTKAAAPESGGPRVFDESASPNSYSSSASTAAGIPIRTSTGGGARSSSSPPAFSPVSTRLHRESLPPAFIDTATTTTTNTTTTTPRAKRRRSGSRHSRRLRSGLADTAQGNDLEEYTLVEEYTYERKYSRSDDAVHLLRQHRWVDRQTGTGTHERERSRWIFKRSFESANIPSGSSIHPENDMLVDVEDVLDSDGEGAVGCLRPSLSRKGRSRRVKPKVSLSLSLASNQEREARRREESVGSGWGRKMFIVGDGEGSDAENDNDNDTNGCEAEKRSAEEDMVDVDAEEERRERDSRDREERQTTRRYHALLELVTTELGYLQDLRALVSIYLQQLPLLDVPIPTTLSKSTPSSLSISNLGLSRPFPSSRSFLHTSNAQHPGPGPPPSQDTSTSPPSASDRHRDAFDGERTREIESAFLTVTPKDATTHTNNHTTKPSRRPLFSEQDVQLITRNASELLAVHETFVKMLKYALEPHGFGEVFAAGAEMKKKVTPVEDKEEVDNAAKAVMELFCQQASSFEVYEPFCPGHNEATDLIRTVQEHHPVEWDAFEQRCSLRVSHAFDHQGSPSMDSLRGSIKSKRRHSLSSLAMPMSLSPFGAVGLVPPVPLSVIGQAKSDTLANRHKRKGSGDVVSPSSSSSAAQAANSQIGRLKFLDYLIKPVQRICKYPLLLDQLKVKCSESELGEEGEEDLVEAASAAMRRVVALVDRASEKRTQTLKSNLIASRLLAECPASPTSPVHVTVDDRRTQLSTEFMQSLGMCMLAGALDVVYYQSNGSARAKYLATFLYPGGYVVLAKVPKGGKAYDPKHWFSLGGFEIVVDQEDDEALPYAFHLCSPTAQIHFAASCQLEKTIWIAAIQESLAIEHEPWVNEPTINLPTDIRPLVFATPEDLLGSEWSATPLPTIQSMSELETPADASNAPAPPTSSPTRKMHKTMSRADSLVLRQDYDMAKLNRRTSTTSVKAFFAPLTFDSRVTRPSSQIRQQVDNGLHDVLSETFVVVRSQVIMRDEELFQLRKKSGNVSRSNSALSISGAFGTRRQRDGVALSARRKGSMDGQIDLTNDYEGVGKATNLILARRSKSSSAKIKRQRLSLLPSVVPPMPTKVDQDENLPVVERSQSPSPLTRGPSAASSNTNSVLPSPIELTMPLPTPGSIYNRSPDSRRADRPKRTRSMVDNVKYFFHSRSTSPTPSFPYQQSPRVSVVNLDVESETHGGLIQWWRRGSIRRRAQSSPDAATDDSAPVTPAASSSDDSSHTDLQAITDGDLLSASPPNDRRRHVSFSRDRTTLSRRRSLFASSSFTSTTRLEQPSSLKAQTGQLTLAPSQTFKNFFTFQRSPSQPGDIN